MRFWAPRKLDGTLVGSPKVGISGRMAQCNLVSNGVGDFLGVWVSGCGL